MAEMSTEASSSGGGRKKKPAAMSLQAFQSEVAGEVLDPDDRLPDGPTLSNSLGSAERKVWISEWEGHEEVLVSDALVADGPRSAAAVDTVESFKAALDPCLRELLSNGDLIEATRCILELGAPQFHYQIVKRGVALAMDKAGREREMIAVLLSTLHVRRVLTSAQLAEGFRALLDSIDDLMLDIPDAPALVSHFLADSHLDGLLPLVEIDRLDAAYDVAPDSVPAGVLRQARARFVGRLPTGGSQVDARLVRSNLRVVVEEYLNSHDVREVSRRCTELATPADLQHELVRAAIELALERKDHDRELVSKLLSSLHDEWLGAEAVARGFEQLLARVDDLSIDNPRACEHLAAFMTRAVADEILPPAFVATTGPDALSTAAQRTTLTQARAPLAASHFGERRRHVWGAAADGSLAELKKEVAALCQEYTVSGEIEEAVRCVRELEAPSFHHEVIKRLVSTSLVDGGPREHELAVQLTSRLQADDLLTTEQLAQGCHRLVDAAPDLRLDHPRAPELLADYLERCCSLSLLSPEDEWRAMAKSLRSGGA